MLWVSHVWWCGIFLMFMRLMNDDEIWSVYEDVIFCYLFVDCNFCQSLNDLDDRVSWWRFFSSGDFLLSDFVWLMPFCDESFCVMCLKSFFWCLMWNDWVCWVLVVISISLGFWVCDVSVFCLLCECIFDWVFLFFWWVDVMDDGDCVKVLIWMMSYFFVCNEFFHWWWWWDKEGDDVLFWWVVVSGYWCCLSVEMTLYPTIDFEVEVIVDGEIVMTDCGWLMCCCDDENDLEVFVCDVDWLFESWFLICIFLMILYSFLYYLSWMILSFFFDFFEYRLEMNEMRCDDFCVVFSLIVWLIVSVWVWSWVYWWGGWLNCEFCFLFDVMLSCYWGKTDERWWGWFECVNWLNSLLFFCVYLLEL